MRRFLTTLLILIFSIPGVARALNSQELLSNNPASSKLNNPKTNNPSDDIKTIKQIDDKNSIKRLKKPQILPLNGKERKIAKTYLNALTSIKGEFILPENKLNFRKYYA